MVRSALEFYGAPGEGIEIFETHSVRNLAELVQSKGVRVVILVKPQIHELMCSFVARQVDRVPVIAVGNGVRPSTQEVADARLDGYVSMDELHRLPVVIEDVLSRAHKQPRTQESSHDARQMNADARQVNADALRESQKLASIGRLAAEIAHEINNPLESVGNLLYLAQCEAHLPERAAEYLRGAERELSRVVQISKQTLSFHRESNQPIQVHVTELMDEVVALYSRRIQNKKVRVQREYASGQIITALPGEIRQVLSNLVTNAIEASSVNGTLRLRIQRSQSGQTEGLRITVADNGTGIPEEARRRIGELFFTTKGQAGTGLGLWVTKAIVARYGGSMRVRSSTGERHGTVFSLFLPFEASARRADVEGFSLHQAAQQELPVAATRRKNVTEISDHPHHFENSSHAARGRSQGPFLQGRKG